MHVHARAVMIFVFGGRRHRAGLKTYAITVDMLETGKRAAAATHRFSTSRLFLGLITGSLKFMLQSAIRSESASPTILNAKSSASRNTGHEGPPSPYPISHDQIHPATKSASHHFFFDNTTAFCIPSAYIHPRDPQTDHLGIQFAQQTIPRNSADNFDVPTSRLIDSDPILAFGYFYPLVLSPIRRSTTNTLTRCN